MSTRRFGGDREYEGPSVSAGCPCTVAFSSDPLKVSAHVETKP